MHTAQVAIRIDHPATGEPVDTEEELRQLLAWFRYEDAFRGQVRLDTLPTAPHQMGAGWVDAIVGGVSSGAAGALVASVIAWVERRRTRDKGGAVTIEFSTDDGKQLRLSCDSTTDGAALLDSLRRFFALHGAMPEGRGSGPLDGGSHFYNVYETADGKHITFGAVEPKFHRELLDRLGLDHFQVEQLDHDGWPQLRETITKVVHTRTRAQWQEHLEGTDVCFAPVLDAAEAPLHRHHLARGTFVTVDGEVQAAPGPRFDRTPPPLPLAPHPVGADALTILADLGFSEAEIERLAASEAVRMPKRSQ